MKNMTLREAFDNNSKSHEYNLCLEDLLYEHGISFGCLFRDEDFYSDELIKAYWYQAFYDYDRCIGVVLIYYMQKPYAVGIVSSDDFDMEFVDEKLYRNGKKYLQKYAGHPGGRPIFKDLDNDVMGTEFKLEYSNEVLDFIPVKYEDEYVETFYCGKSEEVKITHKGEDKIIKVNKLVFTSLSDTGVEK